LEFADKRPLGERGLYWLKVQLSNLFGNDKCSLDDRARFADERMEEIRACASDPLTNRWWLEADAPWQALATLGAIAEAEASGDPERYESGVPVHMDGSCNGLQHYAALGRDSGGGAAVNLTAGERPGDVYSGVLDIVRRKVHDVVERGPGPVCEDTGQSADPKRASDFRCATLVRDHLTRKVVKQTVMTSVYGVTFIGGKQQIYSQLRTLNDPGGPLEHVEDDDIYQASGFLCGLTLNSLGELFAGANAVKEWLTDCAHMVARQGEPITWVSPLGLPIVQPYRRPGKFLVRTALQSLLVADNDEDLPVMAQRQRSAFPPNYVHSLDSTHMMQTALRCREKGIVFTAVHDSYWTHAADVEVMNAELREAFVDLHSQPLLDELRDSLSLRSEEPVPPVPEKGNLDLRLVMGSDYFFN
jgi:DNA-directed RNA polymerase